ncbi:MAG: Dps family protein [Bdellovibrionia bacterium]
MANSEKVIAALSKTLAEEYILMLKTQNYHWNVEGPLFFSLHSLFETHYTFLATKVDEIAEIIRARGVKAPGSFAEFKKLSAIEEASAESITANQMIDILTKDHVALAEQLKSFFEAAGAAGDNGSASVFDSLIAFHEKAAWMIRSHKL